MSESRKTHWSTIKEIKDLGNGFVEYLEEYDLNHPNCPLVVMPIKQANINYYAERIIRSKEDFELLFGSVEEIVK